MRCIIEKADQLALLGSPLEHEYLLDYITEGHYRAIVEMVNGRDVPITIDELHEKLINHESTLKITNSSDVNMPVTANVTNVHPQQSTNSFNSSRGGSNSVRGGSRQLRPYLGKCQLCEVQGHGAKRCPHYQQQSTHITPGVHQHAQHQQPQFHGYSLWLAPHLPLPTPQWQQQTHHATMSSPDMSPWLLDNGASHHIASDFNNLSLHTTYNGSDSVTIGNGAGLPITHTGLVSIPSKSRSLLLQNVLCVLDMKKNFFLSTNYVRLTMLWYNYVHLIFR